MAIQCCVKVEHRLLERECCQQHEDEHPGYSWQLPCSAPFQAGIGTIWTINETDESIDVALRRDFHYPWGNLLGSKWEVEHERRTT